MGDVINAIITSTKPPPDTPLVPIEANPTDARPIVKEI